MFTCPQTPPTGVCSIPAPKEKKDTDSWPFSTPDKEKMTRYDRHYSLSFSD